MSDQENVQTLPVLPLKNSVLFPQLLMPLSAGRPGSVAAVEAALATEEKELLVVAQRSNSVDVPQAADLYTVGTKAVIKRMSHPSEGAVEMIVLGMERMTIVNAEPHDNYLQARAIALPLPTDDSTEVEALRRATLDLAAKAFAAAQTQGPVDLNQMLAATEDPLRLAYLLASMFSLSVDKEQALLEAQSRAEALRLLYADLSHEVQVLELRSKIQSQAQTEMSKEQREYMLRQQLRAIQNELGEKNPQEAEIDILRGRIEKAEFPEEVRKDVLRELSSLEKLPPGAPDYHVIRTYLEFVLDLPWTKMSEDQLDIARARQILDEDHYDLKDVKERILEQLGVLKLNPSAKAPILCFVGPPGTGKTSLGHSIAHALGRKFERTSLGGMHDEAELRGHRRTYIGAMPGRIIQAIRRAGAKNPVLMLDEVDKLGRDFRGDPAAALLEVLDPEQNREFRDNYLDLPFDLSKVLFITTANTLETVPQPLLDRMEVLRLPGYSEEEKVEIARRYLIPRQLKETGLNNGHCQIPDEVVQALVTRYTREAGVRQLERSIGRVMRKIALKFAEGTLEPVCIRPEELTDLLGPGHFYPEQMRKNLPAGVAVGLAWTETGGEVLYVEATLLPGGRGLTLTGHLGEVMQESVKTAQSYIWSHAGEIGIERSAFKDTGVHVHVPAGAIPKDGPSAGTTMCVAMTSMYTRLPARADTAMTGEITLAGLVLPIGGLKEKVLAARRSGIRRVVLPRPNEQDLRELPDHVRNEMEFILADRIEDVLVAVIPGIMERLAITKS